MLSNAIVATVVLAVANHIYLKKYEPSRTQIVQAAALLVLQPVLLLRYLSPSDFSRLNASIVCTVFLSTLTLSIVLYRVSPFHPLAKVPGPTIYKISKLYRAYICWEGHQHLALKALHDRYGPIVRIGPNEVSVINVESIKSVLGTDGLPKGPGYLTGQMVGKPVALVQANGQDRIDRRRLWSRGFTAEATKDHGEVVRKKASDLEEGLRGERNKSEVNLGRWFDYYSFDFMAEMMFSFETRMLQDGDKEGAIEIFREGIRSNELFSHLPWFTVMKWLIPTVLINGLRMQRFAATWFDRRIKQGSWRKDFWYHFTDEAGLEKVKPIMDIVVGESILGIVAGSDTTSAALTNIFWCLLANPRAYERLQEEVDREYPLGIDPLLDTSRHPNMKYLTACINEALRILPPLPSNGPRVVPAGSGGRMLCGHFIPENTQVYVPHYSVHRNPENFSPDPDAFVPERWLEKSKENVLKASAFIPFSAGPAGCIGKNLARLEIMMILPMLLQKFTFKFADGFDWKSWPEKKIDAFVAISEPLNVTVEPR